MSERNPSIYEIDSQYLEGPTNKIVEVIKLWGKIERGQAGALPEQIKAHLKEAGADNKILAVLKERVESWNDTFGGITDTATDNALYRFAMNMVQELRAKKQNLEKEEITALDEKGTGIFNELVLQSKVNAVSGVIAGVKELEGLASSGTPYDNDSVERLKARILEMLDLTGLKENAQYAILASPGDAPTILQRVTELAAGSKPEALTQLNDAGTTRLNKVLDKVELRHKTADAPTVREVLQRACQHGDSHPLPDGLSETLQAHYGLDKDTISSVISAFKKMTADDIHNKIDTEGVVGIEDVLDRALIEAKRAKETTTPPPGAVIPGGEVVKSNELGTERTR